uniref:SFRICE_019502 n=1 Tax=Spodoptera frugiperda TaxID=7108 RepID=A0A2H1WPN7_SPOFR
MTKPEEHEAQTHHPDDYFSPPTSPPAVRRPGRSRPSTGLGARGRQTPKRVPVTGGCARRMKWFQTINENVMRAYYGATEGETNLTAYREKMLSMFQVLDPSVNVSAQRLSDQVQRLDKAALNRLRLETVHNRVVFASPQSVAPTVSQNLKLTTSVPGWEDDRVEQVSTQCNERMRSALEAENLYDTQSILYYSIEAVAVCRVANVRISNLNAAVRPKPAVRPAVDWERSNQDVTDGRRSGDDATNTFWRNIWSVPVSHTEDD